MIASSRTTPLFSYHIPTSIRIGTHNIHQALDPRNHFGLLDFASSLALAVAAETIFLLAVCGVITPWNPRILKRRRRRRNSLVNVKAQLAGSTYGYSVGAVLVCMSE